jgi:hypothetical protein
VRNAAAQCQLRAKPVSDAVGTMMVQWLAGEEVRLGVRVPRRRRSLGSSRPSSAQTPGALGGMSVDASPEPPTEPSLSSASSTSNGESDDDDTDWEERAAEWEKEAAEWEDKAAHNETLYLW